MDKAADKFEQRLVQRMRNWKSRRISVVGGSVSPVQKVPVLKVKAPPVAPARFNMCFK